MEKLAEIVKHNRYTLRVIGATALLGVAPVARAQVKQGGVITTIAGGRMPHGQATEQVFSPSAVTVRSDGAFLLTDYNTASVYAVMPNGHISRIAGNGSAGFSGDNGSAIAAKLGSTLSAAIDGHGNLLIADTNNNRIRRVDARTGVIQTIAGTGKRTRSSSVNR